MSSLANWVFKKEPSSLSWNPWKVLEIRILDFWGRRALIYVLRILSGRASINLEVFFSMPAGSNALRQQEGYAYADNRRSLSQAAYTEQNGEAQNT